MTHHHLGRPAKLTKDKSSRYGLVIGIDRVKRHPQLNLRYAAADAKAIYDVMVDPDCGQFLEGNVKLLLNHEATTSEIWGALSDLRKKAVNEDDQVWIYYAGHAAPETERVYWVTHDSEANDLCKTALDSKRITDILSKSSMAAQTVILILDCCFAAALELQTNRTRAFLTDESCLSPYEGDGRILLAASGAKEESVELHPFKHGAFTYQANSPAAPG